MSKLHSVWFFICRHKYAVVFSIIILVIGFLDDNCFLNRYHRMERLDRLRQEILSYQAQYAEADRRLKELESDPKAVERLAREKYYMRRSNEDVFVVKTPEIPEKDEATTDSIPTDSIN